VGVVPRIVNRLSPSAPPKDVAREVENNVRPRPGRRPGLGLIHNIRTGIPPEKVPALIDAARNLSVY